MTRRISTGSPFEQTFGYSRAVVKGGWCFVSGVTGYNYTTMEMPEGIAAMGEIRPAATMVIAGLIKPEMLIEIEVTAFKG